jgi:hypothetical protein
MLRLYEELEGVLEARIRQAGGEWFEVFVLDLENDSELLSSVRRLYAMYHQLAPETLERISAYIRNNPGEFVSLED